MEKSGVEQKLGYILDHKTGKILAYILGDQKDAASLKLKKLLGPFGIISLTNPAVKVTRHYQSLSQTGKEIEDAINLKEH